MEPKPPTILLVERDLAPTRSLRVELRRRGARVFFAQDAEEARRLAKDSPPGLFE